MRFVVDDQLPPALADRLAALGHETEHVLRIGLGGASDHAIWKAFLARKAVLITKDEDFTELARRPGARCQVVWLRVGNTTAEALWRALEPIFPNLLSALEAGERVVEIA